MSLEKPTASRPEAKLSSVATTDPFAVTVTLLVLVSILCALAIWVHFQWTGTRPEESWGEVVSGIVLIAVAGYLAVRWRLARIRHVLEHGARAIATVERRSQADIWTRLTVSYPWNGSSLRRTVWLASGRRSARLIEGMETEVYLLPERPRRLVLAELHR